ncbi:MAG: MBL fold metallo-hydrolase [Balneolaceae bacterium]|nr:MBL fold metallo-hydrolase [Balneolaceae bacterium]
MILKARFAALLIFSAFLTISACTEMGERATQQSPEAVTGEFSPTLKLHFIDVGQGDATLIEGDGFNILVDAGRHDRNDVVPYLELAGIESIDLLVGTHPHADHIGQFPQVLEFASVDEVWMSGDLHTTITFENALDAIEASGASYREPRAGESKEFGDLKIDVLHPYELTGDLNDGSVVLRLDYHDLSFLLTGDAERAAELEMTERSGELRSEILKLGHHGSSSSTTQIFLDKVTPEIAVYSAAKDNSYGHPHSEVTDRLDEKGVRFYGTDQSGTILIETDGDEYRVSTSANGEPLDEPEEEDLYENGDLTGDEGCIDINRASLTELTEIIHIGGNRAEGIRDRRPFDSLEELTEIGGISQNRLEEIMDEGKACIPEIETENR